MFGLKLNPKNVLPMLKGLGIDINELTPEIIEAIKAWFIKQESEAGAPLLMTLQLSQSKDFFLCAMYKNIDNKLELYQTFDLTNISELINKLIDGIK